MPVAGNFRGTAQAPSLTVLVRSFPMPPVQLPSAAGPSANWLSASADLCEAPRPQRFRLLRSEHPEGRHFCLCRRRVGATEIREALVLRDVVSSGVCEARVPLRTALSDKGDSKENHLKILLALLFLAAMPV